MSRNDDIDCIVGERRIRTSRCSVDIHRRKRRYLVVPETEAELSMLENAYCDDHDDQQEHEVQGKYSHYRAKCKGFVPSRDASTSSSQRSSSRMLPSTQVLVSLMNDTKIKCKIETTETRSSVNKKSLLLEKFYEAIGMEGNPRLTIAPIRTADEDVVMSDKKKAREMIDEIDDPSLSTFTIGQHRRYLQLTSNSKNHQASKRTFAQRKELNKLQNMVLKEQALYRLALDKFHNCYKSRYLIGFESNSSDTIDIDGKTDASAFCRWSCFQAQAINREWEKKIAVFPNSTNPKPGSDNNNNAIYLLPRSYGKVRQTLALHVNTQCSTFDIQDLTCSVVHQSILTSQVRSTQSSTSSLGEKIPEASLKDIGNIRDGAELKKIPPPTMELAPAVKLLGNDQKALELAVKYSATIVTTSETLETLLRLPGDHSTKWTLPCITKKNPMSNPGPASISSSLSSVIILDLPIAQAFPSPRSCIEMGFREGLYQVFLKQHQSLQPDGTSTPLLSQFVYSLWTLPPQNTSVKNGSRQPIRVIVRSLVRLRDSMSKVPIRLRASVEYFSSSVTLGDNINSRSRREIPNSYEKSLWILDQVLFGHQVFCLQYRIDPTTCEVLGCYSTSVAHAFASPSSSSISNHSKAHSSDLGPLQNWKVLIQLLQSIPSIDIPEALLRLPGLVGETTKAANYVNDEGLLGEPATSTAHRNQQTQHQQVRVDKFSVSVHAPCEFPSDSKKKETEGDTSTNLPSASTSYTGTITLDESMLGQAGTVLLGYQCLLDCRRDWEWDRLDQVPNTFPVVDFDKTHV